ncbi:MAG TPA: hypothetical protein VLM38_13845 [Blastocatellia bacterium]|nr:hypothetical protein [Blastocatellia bacterium]
MKNTARIMFALVAFLIGSLSASIVTGQQSSNQKQPVASYSDIYCTGFISDVAPRVDLQVVGAEQENLKATFAQGDVVFLNRGRRAGIQPGAVYSIIRPLGEMNHPFTKKRLGHLVREVGMLRVIEVGDQTSTAEITVSCDTVEFGDLLKPYEEIQGPNAGEARPLPRYGEGSGGTTGQIVMSPGFHENLSANRVVFIDLGTRQDVHPGDVFTIYREIGRREGLTNVPQDKIVKDRSSGYESERLRGGTHSIQGTRVSAEQVLRERPPLPRKVLGELVVIRTEKGTSVAMITRTTAEVQIGDMIERSMN